MSETQGEAAPRIYDGHHDTMRPASQADIDLLQGRMLELGLLWTDLRSLVARTRATLPPPFVGVTGPHATDGTTARDGEWLHLHLDGDIVKVSHAGAEDLIGRLQYALSRRKATP